MNLLMATGFPGADAPYGVRMTLPQTPARDRLRYLRSSRARASDTPQASPLCRQPCAAGWICQSRRDSGGCLPPRSARGDKHRVGGAYPRRRLLRPKPRSPRPHSQHCLYQSAPQRCLAKLRVGCNERRVARHAPSHAGVRSRTHSGRRQGDSFPVRRIQLGLLIGPLENDFVLVKTPQDNLPLLNDYIGVAHLLNFSILNCEREWGLIPLKKEEKSFGILK